MARVMNGGFMKKVEELMTNRITTTHGSINTVAICKGPEKYIVLFDDAHRSEALRQLGRWAANRKLSFDWYDAAKASQAIRRG